MKLDLEIYDLNQKLWTIKGDAVVTFSPKRLRITSEYGGYSGNNWGDVTHKTGGFPIKVFYSETEDLPGWIPHEKLFPSKEALLKSL